MQNSDVSLLLNYFIFIVSETELVSGKRVSAYDVLEYRLMHNIWGLNKHTKNRLLIKQGAKAVFYIAGQKKLAQHFVASAEILNKVSIFPNANLPKYAMVDDWLFDIPAYELELGNIKWFKSPVSIHELRSQMELFKNKNVNKWGILFQGGVRRISKRDYELITSASKINKQ